MDDPFLNDPPLTDHMTLRELWYDMKEVKEQTRITNGRVNKLERLSYMFIGGLLVVSVFITPLLIQELGK